MKRLLLISLLSLGFLSNLGASSMRPSLGYTPTTGRLAQPSYDALSSYPNYDSYVAAVDSGNFNPFGEVVDAYGTYGTSGISYDGLALVIKTEGLNSPRAQKIKASRDVLMRI